MGGITKGLFGGGDAGRSAGDAEVEGQRLATEESKRQFNLTREDFKPYREAGYGALDVQQNLLGLNGAEQQQAAFKAFQESPGQAFLREQGEKALLRNASAIGGLGGGNIRSALQQQGIGYANQAYGDYYNRLAGISGAGQSATSTGAQIGAQLSGQIQQGLIGQGEARASGILAGQQGDAQSARNAVALGSFIFSDIRLKKDIKKTGELDSGLNTYTWTWTDEAKEIVGSQPAFGVIAQEVQKIIPDAVQNIDGYLVVDYARVY